MVEKNTIESNTAYWFILISSAIVFPVIGIPLLFLEIYYGSKKKQVGLTEKDKKKISRIQMG